MYFSSFNFYHFLRNFIVFIWIYDLPRSSPPVSLGSRAVCILAVLLVMQMVLSTEGLSRLRLFWSQHRSGWFLLLKYVWMPSHYHLALRKPWSILVWCEVCSKGSEMQVYYITSMEKLLLSYSLFQGVNSYKLRNTVHWEIWKGCLEHKTHSLELSSTMKNQHINTSST